VGDVPTGAGSRRFAGAWGSGEGLLFGGYASANLDELYRVVVEGSGLRFEAITQVAPVPQARALHAFVYDPETSRYFLFGGVSNQLFDDTWSLTVSDGTAAWTQLPIIGPSARYGFFYGFDETAGRMLLFSGAQGTQMVDAAADTWALDVRTEPPSWSLLLDASASPPGRRNGCGVWDAIARRLIVMGGTPDAMTTAPGLHVLDARPGFEAWNTLALENEPTARSSGFGFFDGERSYLGFGNGNALYRDWGVLGY
jgi:hypothetical protein